jgi:hypothetical protein
MQRLSLALLYVKGQRFGHYRITFTVQFARGN